MAAHEKYPTPHSQLLRLAAEARAGGVPFDEFWERAVDPYHLRAAVTVGTDDPPATAVRWPRDTADRRIARCATEAARDGWRRAYERQPPSRPERALRILSPMLRELDKRAAAAAEAEGLDDEERLSSAA